MPGYACRAVVKQGVLQLLLEVMRAQLRCSAAHTQQRGLLTVRWLELVPSIVRITQSLVVRCCSTAQSSKQMAWLQLQPSWSCNATCGVLCQATQVGRRGGAQRRAPAGGCFKGMGWSRQAATYVQARPVGCAEKRTCCRCWGIALQLEGVEGCARAPRIADARGQMCVQPRTRRVPYSAYKVLHWVLASAQWGARARPRCSAPAACAYVEAPVLPRGLAAGPRPMRQSRKGCPKGLLHHTVIQLYR